jgi:hypothetical protein
MKIYTALIAACLGALVLLQADRAQATALPIPGVNIIVSKNPSGIMAATSTTNNQGVASFTNLPAGSYRVTLPSGASKTFTLQSAGSFQVSVKGEGGASGQTRAAGQTITIVSGGGGSGR